MELLDFQKAE